MTIEANKAKILLFIEENVNKGNLAAADELIHPDYTEHNYVHEARGPEVVKEWFPYLRHAYPDIHHTIEDIVAEGDTVAWRVTQVGTQKGMFLGNRPTGKRATWTEVHFVRFENGKIIEHWGPFSRRLPGQGTEHLEEAEVPITSGETSDRL
jgi:predicted ester cyclase